MPEGDSIRRVANKLAPLVGQKIVRATTQGLPRALAGRTVTHVDAHGKHLTIDLDDQTQLHVHQGMNGRFLMYARAPGEARLAKTSPGRASLVLVTEQHLYLWLTCPTVEIIPRRAPRAGMTLANLGPDVLAGDFDSRLAAARAALHESRTIGEVLLDQRVVARPREHLEDRVVLRRADRSADARARRARSRARSDLRDRARVDADLRRGQPRFSCVLAHRQAVPAMLDRDHRVPAR